MQNEQNPQAEEDALAGQPGGEAADDGAEQNSVDVDPSQTEVEVLDGDEEIEMSYEALQERVQELEEINAKMADQFVRAKAETDNTRRIKDVEVSKARKFALEGFSKELLQVKDSLDQASQVEISEDSEQGVVDQMKEGLSLTLRQLDSVFDRFNIEEVNPEAGDDLDPELHQPMTMQPSAEIAKNKVVQTIQKGYTLNDRLLRAAMVIVSSGSA